MLWMDFHTQGEPGLGSEGSAYYCKSLPSRGRLQVGIASRGHFWRIQVEVGIPWARCVGRCFLQLWDGGW